MIESCKPFVKMLSVYRQEVLKSALSQCKAVAGQNAVDLLTSLSQYCTVAPADANLLRTARVASGLSCQINDMINGDE